MGQRMTPARLQGGTLTRIVPFAATPGAETRDSFLDNPPAMNDNYHAANKAETVNGWRYTTMARKTIAKKEVDLDARRVNFTFPTLDPAQYPPLVLELERCRDVLPQMALHGGSQKVGDSYAGESDPIEAYNKAREMVDRLHNNDWAAVRAPGQPSTIITILAIARLRNKDPKDIQEIWDKLDDERKKAIRADDNVKAEVLKIKAERAALKAAEAPDQPAALSAFG